MDSLEATKKLKKLCDKFGVWVRFVRCGGRIEIRDSNRQPVALAPTHRKALEIFEQNLENGYVVLGRTPPEGDALARLEQR